MDSPGHCAQYCTYTAMENESREIISVITVDKRETGRNSVIMEREAFVRTVDTLLNEVKLVEVCTDAHVQISALMNKGKYKDLGLQHSLDMWHGAKNLAKRIHAASQVKGQSSLSSWLKDIVNHFWWCCKTADSYQEFLTSKTYGYIPELQAMILQKRLAGKGMPRRRTLRPDDPRRYGPLPPVPAPTIEELLHTQVRRGLVSTFQTKDL
ncbi:uncharacterized protein LOC113087935 isoform X2 [Carassius auratus]|nr:uncharacterized protein LOC113087935 isoform X2 [Carassius auratus]